MSGRRLYIGRLSQDATRKDIEDFFGSSGQGKIVDVRIMQGFCFLEYEELKDAEQAVQELSGKDFMGERLIVEFAKPPRNLDPDRAPRRYDPYSYSGGGGYGDRGGYGGDRGGGYDRGGYGGGGYDRGPPPRGYGFDRPPPRGGGGHRLQVNGVPDGVSWQDLKDFARSAGTVTFADVDRHQQGVGFIEYPSRSDADEAIRTLSNTELKGSIVTIEDVAGGGGGGGGARRDDGYSSSRRDDSYSSSRRDDRGYDRRDDRDRERRRSRSRSPARRRSPPPRERERSPVRERSERGDY